MTDAAHGVAFDFFGTGNPIQTSWTSAGWNGGWLALDRNGNGRIDSGQELFSNVTPQPGLRSTYLGFKALAYYDNPHYGGNGDGWIDAQDSIYSKLRVWVDLNHNGVSEPSEMLTMSQAGIQAISVRYLPDNWADSFGNRFMSRAQVIWSNPNHGNGKGQGDGGGKSQWAYDVILLSR